MKGIVYIYEFIKQSIEESETIEKKTVVGFVSNQTSITGNT